MFTALHDGVANICERDLELNNPLYIRQKEEMHQVRAAAGLVSLATLVLGVAFSILGIAAANGGSFLGSMTGSLALLVSLPLAYFSYNIYCVCDNLRDVIDTPLKYKHLSTDRLDIPKLQAQLSQGTLGFHFFVDLGLQLFQENR